MGVTPGSNNHNRPPVNPGLYSASASAAWGQLGNENPEEIRDHRGQGPSSRPLPWQEDPSIESRGGGGIPAATTGRRPPAAEVLRERVLGSPRKRAAALDDDGDDDGVNEDAVRGVARGEEAEAEREAREAADRNLVLNVEQDEDPWRQLVRVASEEAQRLAAREEAEAERNLFHVQPNDGSAADLLEEARLEALEDDAREEAERYFPAVAPLWARQNRTNCAEDGVIRWADWLWELLIYNIFYVAGTYCFGQTLAEIGDMERAVKATLYECIGQGFAIVGMTIAKASPGFFLLRLVTIRWYRIAIWSMMTLVVLASIAQALCFWLSCVPLDEGWPRRCIAGGSKGSQPLIRVCCILAKGLIKIT
ncbi:hypothetical protein B0T24DRAFT_708916 [Lasiosphaeria ovina]|uniref:Rhodopsin domain-containing protein n=1 Tax=Lasiosphaeria ovina TaxID=92902 RepID=A0AAE0JYE9_9PEZI|nr:hypothetical protein B0T24DRAFT_708916 [Lasiosphaeria ovina]